MLEAGRRVFYLKLEIQGQDLIVEKMKTRDLKITLT